MENSKSNKIDSLLQSVQQRVEERRAEYEAKPEVTWDSFSPQSQEVLEYFGLEAPDKLNIFCCKLEDALLEVVARLKDAQNTIEELHKQYGVDD